MVACVGESLIDIVNNKEFVGGCPFNVALAASRLGAPVSYFGKVSSDRLGLMILERMIDNGVLFDPEEMIRTTNDFGEVMRNSKELPTLETTIEKVNDEFIQNPLVSWKTLFGSDDDEEKKDGRETAAKPAGGEAAESNPEASAPAAVPATSQPGE